MNLIKTREQNKILHLPRKENLKDYLDKGLFSDKTKENCPICGKNTFSIHTNRTLAKCFHPSCGYYSTLWTGTDTGALWDYYNILEIFFDLSHEYLLNLSETSRDTFNAYTYLKNERDIEPELIKLSDIGAVPESNEWLEKITSRFQTFVLKYRDLFNEKCKDSGIEADEFEERYKSIENKKRLSQKDEKLRNIKKFYDEYQESKRLSNEFLCFFTSKDVFGNETIKYPNFIMFFSRDEKHRIQSIKLRKPYSEPKKIYHFKPFNQQGLFNHSLFSPEKNINKNNKINKLNSKFILFEGEFNLLQIQSLFLRNEKSFINAASFGSAASLNPVEINKFIETNKLDLILCFDNDEAGRKVTGSLQKNLSLKNMSFEAFTTPEEGSDMDSFIREKNKEFNNNHQEVLKSVKNLLTNTKTYYWEPDNIDFAIEYDKKGKSKIIYPLIGEYFCRKYHIFSLKDRVYMYNDGVYTENNFKLENLIQKLCGEKTLNSLIAEVMGYIRRNNPVESDELNRQKENYINLKNGMLDWDTGELKPHDPKYFSTCQIPVEYNPDAKCPYIDKFFKSTFEDEKLITLILEMIGYSMIPITKFEKAFLFYGSGANGKSTFVKLLESFIGKNNISSVPVQKLGGDNRFYNTRLDGKLLNIGADIDSSIIQSAGQVKAIISGDRIQAEEKFKNSYEFTPFAKLIYSCNELPATSDTTDAFWRRWITIPFNKQFKGQNCNKNLINEIITPEQLSGLLNLCLPALRKLMKETGEFTETEQTVALLNKYQMQEDSLRAFVDEKCCLEKELNNGKQLKINRTELYNVYKKYCEDTGKRIRKDSLFYEELQRIFGLRTTIIQGFKFIHGIGLLCENST